MASRQRLFASTRPMRYTDVLTCANTKPTFYRVKDPAHPRAQNEAQVWLTKSRGHATCPENGASVITITRDGRRQNLCLDCLAS